MEESFARQFILLEFQMRKSLVVQDSNKNVLVGKGRSKLLVNTNGLRVNVHAFIVVSPLIKVSVRVRLEKTGFFQSSVSFHQEICGKATLNSNGIIYPRNCFAKAIQSFLIVGSLHVNNSDVVLSYNFNERHLRSTLEREAFLHTINR